MPFVKRIRASAKTLKRLNPQGIFLYLTHKAHTGL
jgi:hypothetical protein